jgi:hypothetical protein
LGEVLVEREAPRRRGFPFSYVGTTMPPQKRLSIVIPFGGLPRDEGGTTSGARLAIRLQRHLERLAA